LYSLSKVTDKVKTWVEFICCECEFVSFGQYFQTASFLQLASEHHNGSRIFNY